MELNATCRPYHLGWILEAWSTRPAARALAARMMSTMAAGTRSQIFGVDVDALDARASLDRAFALADAGVPVQHVVLNAAKVVLDRP